jgi:hypothetical protein
MAANNQRIWRHYPIPTSTRSSQGLLANLLGPLGRTRRGMLEPLNGQLQDVETAFDTVDHVHDAVFVQVDIIDTV